MIAIIDYGAGNLLSVKNALNSIGCRNEIVSDKNALASFDKAILPGVGSFGDAMNSMRRMEMTGPVRDFINSGKPFLGICLGMQLLFESSQETPGEEGLGILKGKILKIPNENGLKVPHTGWNNLENTEDCGLYKGIEKNPYVYFVHSYYLSAGEDIVTSNADYSVKIDASIQKNNLFAVQFHPEKSGETGIKMLKNFINYKG